MGGTLGRQAGLQGQGDRGGFSVALGCPWLYSTNNSSGVHGKVDKMGGERGSEVFTAKVTAVGAVAT